MLASRVNVKLPSLGIPAIWEEMMKLISRNPEIYESRADFAVGINTVCAKETKVKR